MSRNDDSTWNYVGQGSMGDQDIKLYANDLILSKNKYILLFTPREPTSKEIRALASRHKKINLKGFSTFCHGVISNKRAEREMMIPLLFFKLIAADNI